MFIFVEDECWQYCLVIAGNDYGFMRAGIQCSVCPQLLPNKVNKDEDKTKS
jgi:hypothetical protein